MHCKVVKLKFQVMSLTFREKNAIAKELANDVHIEKDKQLLRKHLPADKLLLRSVSPSRPDLSFDILYLLLDFEPRESIISHRKSSSTEKTPEPVAKQKQKVSKNEKKKLQKRKSIPISSGQNLKVKTSEMLTQCIQTGSIAIAGCANWIKRLK